MQSAEVYLAIPNGVYTHQACNRHYFRVSEVRLVKTNRSPWNSLLIYCRITQLFVGISCFQLLIHILLPLISTLLDRSLNKGSHRNRLDLRTIFLQRHARAVLREDTLSEGALRVLAGDEHF